MAKKRRGLGSGLDVLIPENDELINKEEVLAPDTVVKISNIEPNRKQPRKHFNEDAIIALSESIKQYGVLSPLWVQEIGEGKYEIIAGERRWRASKKAGLKEVPVIIMNEDEQKVLEISLIENIQREDLNPIEEALAYKRLIEEFKLTQDEVAKKVSKSRPVIANAVRLLDLDEKVQQMLIDEKITEGHGRLLLKVSDKDKQFELATKIMDQELTVRETEKLLKSLEKSPEKKPDKQERDLSFIYQDLEEKMKAIMGTKVSILPKSKKKGKIEIEYYSTDDLERIVELLQTIEK